MVCYLLKEFVGMQLLIMFSSNLVDKRELADYLCILAVVIHIA